jgi:hypothetical protein
MSLVRAIPIVALLAMTACASHVQRIARSAAQGVKAQVAEIDPAHLRALGDQAARGAVSGALAELESERYRERLDELVHSASEAAARGFMTALGPDSAQWREVVDRTVASAVDAVGRRLAADATLHEQLAALGQQLSASVVHGAKDAIGDVFPQCAEASDRRRCVENEVRELSRAATRGMMGGVLGSLRWPLLALVFLAGALVALLLVRVRSVASSGHAPVPKHAG